MRKKPWRFLILVLCPAADAAEVALGPEKRQVLRLIPGAVTDGGLSTPDLGPEDVIVITGGARGVTAEAAVSMARCSCGNLVLLGRTPAPGPEPAWLAGIEGEAEIKEAIFKNALSAENPSPVELETRFQRIRAAREISRNLAAMEKTGATVRYYTGDVRNPAVIGAVLDEVRAFFGPVTAIVHGAGVLEDRLIVEKTEEQFDRVFSTKVRGLMNLLVATRDDPVRSIVLFSSVAARFGNRGQADYAMANEVLNKAARIEAEKRPECRVRSINWGPWDGGMVTPALKREFSRRGVSLIPPSAGVRALLAEMAEPAGGPVEVVLGAEIRQDAGQQDAAAKGLVLTLRREVDVKNYPVLASHRLDGKPVIPFALITDWLGHGALRENPGLELIGMDDIRVLKGIRLDAEKRLVRLLAGKAEKDGDVYRVRVEARDGVEEGREVVHYRARAVLADRPREAPDFSIPEFPDAVPYPRSAEEIYRDILFHGDHLQGIRRIVKFSSRGMVAELDAAPEPARWMTEPPSNRWAVDPLVLDCAFQMSILWSYETVGQVCLPSYSAAYRQYRLQFPASGVVAVMEIRNATEARMVSDFTFLDGAGRVISQLKGCEAVMDPSLFRSFKPEMAVLRG